MLELKNGKIKVLINEIGAQMQYIHDEHENNYLWDGIIIWNRHAPMHFPIIGDYMEDEPLNFGRSLTFKFVEGQKDWAKFTTTYTDETLKVYNHKFEMEVLFKLIDRSVTVQYTVKNVDNSDMTFEVAGQPTFTLADVISEFNVTTPNDRIPLNYKMFEDGAYSCPLNNSSTVSLVNDSISYNVTLETNNFDNLDIWTDTDNPYICLIPKTKQTLNCGKEFSCSYTVKI